ncbi:MAG: hypothetical protein ACYDCQ_19055 [Dehalococcoidia bacterium]
MPDATSPLSPGRRGVIKRGLALVAGGLGLGAVAGRGTAAAAGAATAPMAPAPRSLTLLGRGFHLYGSDRPFGATPLRGDRVAAAGTLHDAAGSPLGEFHSAVFCTSSPFSPGAEPLAYLEQHTFKLADGLLIGTGLSGSGDDEFAIVGGTGAYLGARGSYTASQRPFDMGGDGNAEFHFNFAV